VDRSLLFRCITRVISTLDIASLVLVPYRIRSGMDQSMLASALDPRDFQSNLPQNSVQRSMTNQPVLILLALVNVFSGSRIMDIHAGDPALAAHSIDALGVR
jgi:hypothetical protein